MQVADFDYTLPPELIAQYPADTREQSRLMVIRRATGDITHATFADIVHLFDPSDVLVINNTKVIPARLIGQKEKTRGKVEIFLLRQLRETAWEALIGGKVAPGMIIAFGDSELRCRIIRKKPDGSGEVEFEPQPELKEKIYAAGSVPLPPYIKRDDGVLPADLTRYQTVYAQQEGAVAAPTAGLHFSESLLAQIQQKGIDIIPVTLHVGIGTFRPVKVERVEDHQIHAEWYELSAESAQRLVEALTQRRRIITVGTTSTRLLEAVYAQYGRIQAGSGWADIFMYPGFQFQVTQALITNFHLPKSSLLMLVAAFGGMELIRKAYQEAIAQRYRFYSYGDAMCIF